MYIRSASSVIKYSRNFAATSPFFEAFDTQKNWYFAMFSAISLLFFCVTGALSVSINLLASFAHALFADFSSSKTILGYQRIIEISHCMNKSYVVSLSLSISCFLFARFMLPAYISPSSPVHHTHFVP